MINLNCFIYQGSLDISCFLYGNTVQRIQTEYCFMLIVIKLSVAVIKLHTDFSFKLMSDAGVGCQDTPDAFQWFHSAWVSFTHLRGLNDDPAPCMLPRCTRKGSSACWQSSPPSRGLTDQEQPFALLSHLTAGARWALRSAQDFAALFSNICFSACHLPALNKCTADVLSCGRQRLGTARSDGL